MADIFDLFKKIERAEPAQPITHIVVGLGNIGKEYEKTRHNAGFLCLDYIAKKCNVSVNRVKFHATVGEGMIAGKRVLLMQPTTFMNNSGVAVAEAASFYKVAPENIIVICDEISFDVGKFRIRRRGSAGGHNGLKSIIAHLGSEGFVRIKVGIGNKPSPDYDLADWVLGKFSQSELATLAECYSDVHSSVELILSDKIDDAMSRYSH